MNQEHSGMIVLPRALKAYRQETLISYVGRTVRHSHLPKSKVLAALDHRDPRFLVRRWAHVDTSFFTALSCVTRQPEAVLRDRLSEWTEGLPAGSRFPLAPPRSLTIAGVTCANCSAKRDGAVLASEFTALEHLCGRHQRWTIDSTRQLTAGTEAIDAAARFRSRRSHSESPTLHTLAFEIAYTDLRKMFLRRTGRTPLDQIWDQRAEESTGAPEIAPYYPEIARLATRLLDVPITAIDRRPATDEDAQAVFGHTAYEARPHEIAVLTDLVDDVAAHYVRVALTDSRAAGEPDRADRRRAA